MVTRCVCVKDILPLSERLSYTNAADHQRADNTSQYLDNELASGDGSVS